MPWNQRQHRRKFILANATYRDEASVERRGPVVFWGEWEPPSRVVASWPPDGDLPRYLHQPTLGPPPEGAHQNTDPYVFGEAFYYSCCKQRTNKGRTPTAMQRLTPGSVVLFGSTLAHEFVLDTVFVVGRPVGRHVPGRPTPFQVDDVFRAAVIEPIGSEATQPASEDRYFTLFEGATTSRPVGSMFSFVPCLPADGDGPRFGRPVIELPGIINPASRQAPSGATKPRAINEVAEAWDAVVSQVLDHGLLLATRLALDGMFAQD